MLIFLTSDPDNVTADGTAQKLDDQGCDVHEVLPTNF